MLSEVQKQLERAFPTRKLMFPVTTTLEIRQELKAATVSILAHLWPCLAFHWSDVLGNSTRLSCMERARYKDQTSPVFDTDPLGPGPFAHGSALRVHGRTAPWRGRRSVR